MYIEYFVDLYVTVLNKKKAPKVRATIICFGAKLYDGKPAGSYYVCMYLVAFDFCSINNVNHTNM